jgi:undecaprenyl-diphosphatase
VSWLEAAFLGIVQGATEFLPVSSDGHLSAAQMLLPRFRQVGVLFDVLAHVGTLAAVVVYFRGLLAAEAAAFVSDVAEDRLGARKLAALVVVATLPTAVIGLLLKPVVELAKWDPRFVGGMEIATGLAVATWMLPRRAARREIGGMRVSDAVAIGIAQGLAVLPGLSRSAMTIAVGLALGLSGLSAARFSLLAALPAILGAAGLELISAWDGILRHRRLREVPARGGRRGRGRLPDDRLAGPARREPAGGRVRGLLHPLRRGADRPRERRLAARRPTGGDRAASGCAGSTAARGCSPSG